MRTLAAIDEAVTRQDRAHEDKEARLRTLEEWRANVKGTLLFFPLIGSVLGSVLAALLVGWLRR